MQLNVNGKQSLAFAGAKVETLSGNLKEHSKVYLFRGFQYIGRTAEIFIVQLV